MFLAIHVYLDVNSIWDNWKVINSLVSINIDELKYFAKICNSYWIIIIFLSIIT
jgi:hypothetical protein